MCEAVIDTSKTWRESGWEKKDQVMLLWAKGALEMLIIALGKSSHVDYL